MSISVDRAWAADTSFAVAAVDASHEAHQLCRDVARERRPALAGHAAYEAHAVLTRLPGPARVPPATAATVLARAFPERCWLRPEQQTELAERLGELGLVGGMVYDALVAEAARRSRRSLLTRDLRAVRTYELIGVRFELIR